MGYEIKMPEVMAMRKAIENAGAECMIEIARAYSALREAVDTDVLQGETADAFNLYISEVHEKVKNDIFTEIGNFIDKIRGYEDGFRAIDISDEAHINQDVLESVQRRLKAKNEEFNEHIKSLSEITDVVNDIITVVVPNSEQILEQYSSASEISRELYELIGEFEAEHVGDCTDICGKLDSVLSIIQSQDNELISIEGYTVGKL